MKKKAKAKAKNEKPRWYRQLVSAIRLNANDAELRAIANREHRPADAALLAALHVRKVLPYRFDGQGHRILELEAALRRGYGACGDATAAVAATVLLTGGECSVCYESTRTVPGYAHVRVVVEGVVADAYPDASLAVDRCTATFRVSRGAVRWQPVSLADALLDEEPPRVGRG